MIALLIIIAIIAIIGAIKFESVMKRWYSLAACLLSVMLIVFLAQGSEIGASALQVESNIVAPRKANNSAALEARKPDTGESAVSTGKLATSQPVLRCGENGIATNETYGVSEKADLREAPRMDAKRFVNEKATAVLGETQYEQIDGSTVVRELCRQEDWSEVRIVEPDWLTDHRGWVPSKVLRTIEQTSMGRRIYVESDFYWDKSTKNWKQTVIGGVNKVAQENADCVNLDAASASRSTTKGTKKDPVFFVTCHDANGRPFNVWFSASEVKSGKTMAAIALVDQNEAVNACEQAAEAAASHPSTVDFSRLLHLAVQTWPGGRTRVVSRFTAKNAFNLELNYNISCFFDGDQLIEATISEVQ